MQPVPVSDEFVHELLEVAKEPLSIDRVLSRPMVPHGCEALEVATTSAAQVPMRQDRHSGNHRQRPASGGAALRHRRATDHGADRRYLQVRPGMCLLKGSVAQCLF